MPGRDIVQSGDASLARRLKRRLGRFGLALGAGAFGLGLADPGVGQVEHLAGEQEVIPAEAG